MFLVFIYCWKQIYFVFLCGSVDRSAEMKIYRKNERKFVYKCRNTNKILSPAFIFIINCACKLPIVDCVGEFSARAFADNIFSRRTMSFSRRFSSASFSATAVSLQLNWIHISDHQLLLFGDMYHAAICFGLILSQHLFSDNEPVKILGNLSCNIWKVKTWIYSEFSGSLELLINTIKGPLHSEWQKPR